MRYPVQIASQHLYQDSLTRSDGSDGARSSKTRSRRGHRLPPERTKQGRTSGSHTIHLSSASLGVIADCPRHQGCPFVFTNDGAKAQGDVTRLEKRLDALLAKDSGQPMKPWVFHDSRRSLVSGLAKRGHSPVALDLLLGHKPQGLSAIARIYQMHDFAPKRVKALDQWGQIVTAPLTVVPLSAAKRKRA